MSQRSANAEMSVASASPSWLPGNVSLSGWGMSLIAHAVLMILLAMYHFEVGRSITAVIDSAFDDVSADENFKFDATATDQIGGDMQVGSGFAVSQAAATAVGKNPTEDVSRSIDETLTVRIPSTEQVIQRPKGEMLNAVATTGGSEHASGVEGALDRMAFEIANQLREKKTLVVWLFDVSPSLHKRREVIAQRVENIYGQLNALNVNSDKALKTAVAVFGERTTVLTKDPLDEAADVVKTVRGIKSEDSGKENVFGAVKQVANQFASFRTKQQRAVMIVVVTDEAGSDAEANLEEALGLTKRYGMRCYVIGEQAPLGRRTVESEFTLENGETVIGIMDRGPEGVFQDRLRLGYWGVNGYHLENIPSGFGPYGLTRLCAETNGLYLISDTDNRFPIDNIVMRSYPPDYRPIKLVEKDILGNLAKRAVKEVCGEAQVTSIPLPTTVFPAENDNVLRTNITEAQRPQADLDYKLDAILKKLEAGEKDRVKITEPRWRAVYDLAIGRVLAMRVRSYGYNMMLAEMKASPKKFEKAGNNQWRLQPSKEISSGPATKKLANRAQEYLKRVIDEHSGTPWAILAELEYKTPMGWEWHEGYYNPNPPVMGNAKDKKAPRFVDEVDPKTGKKTKRQLPDQPQRREI